MVYSSLRDIKNAFRTRLKVIYPVLEIDSIFSQVIEETLKISRLKQIELINENPFNQNQANEIIKILERLEQNEPVQHITGKAWFYELPFNVDKNVLIPRQETELLVDRLIKTYSNQQIKILDIGTGSGCIAIALKYNSPNAEVFALDISQEAIEVAKQNSGLNKTEVGFIAGDILNPDFTVNLEFDLIVSNPPYITQSEKELMHKNVLEFEPHMALFVPDSNPLIFYKAIAGFCKKHLRPGGMLAMEINEALGNETANLLNGLFSDIEIMKDLNNKNRFVFARKI